MDKPTESLKQPPFTRAPEQFPKVPWWLSSKRISLQCRRPGFEPSVGMIPYKRERLPTLVFWPGEFHGLYSQSMGSQRVGLNLATFTHSRIVRGGGGVGVGEECPLCSRLTWLPGNAESCLIYIFRYQKCMSFKKRRDFFFHDFLLFILLSNIVFKEQKKNHCLVPLFISILITKTRMGRNSEQI